MTNPFNNPFDAPDFGDPAGPSPQVPAPNPMYSPPTAQHPFPQFAPTSLAATTLPGPWQTVRKALGWVVLLFGALMALGVLVDWSDLGISIAMMFFAAAFILTGATMIWKVLPWRIAGPATAVLVVICFVIAAITSPDTADSAASAISTLNPGR